MAYHSTLDFASNCQIWLSQDNSRLKVLHFCVLLTVPSATMVTLGLLGIKIFYWCQTKEYDSTLDFASSCQLWASEDNLRLKNLHFCVLITGPSADHGDSRAIWNSNFLFFLDDGIRFYTWFHIKLPKMSIWGRFKTENFSFLCSFIGTISYHGGNRATRNSIL